MTTTAAPSTLALVGPKRNVPVEIVLHSPTSGWAHIGSSSEPVLVNGVPHYASLSLNREASPDHWRTKYADGWYVSSGYGYRTDKGHGFGEATEGFRKIMWGDDLAQAVADLARAYAPEAALHAQECEVDRLARLAEDARKTATKAAVALAAAEERLATMTAAYLSA